MRLPWLLSLVALAACSKSESNAPRPPDPVLPGVAAEKVAPVAPAQAAVGSDLPLAQIALPPGFHVSVYASKVTGARSLALSPKGTLFVGTRGKDGPVYAIPNADGDAHGDRVIELVTGLNSPNGVVLHEGALFVGEQNRILRFDDIEARFEQKPNYEVVFDKLPNEDHHGWKFIAVGPDEKLYVPIGAPCNVCEEEDPRFASITRMGLDGSGFEIFARGVRNSVGFDWHPVTHALWFTENGRDELGDDLPPDELNSAPRAGMDFGFPYCHAGTIPDPKFGKKKKCADTTPPKKTLGPHVAALGMRFYTGDKFPAQYKNAIFIAEHGSWNRSHKSGYRITLATLKGDNVESYEVFAQGWLQGEQAWGRPVDLLFTRDGAMLVSDDQADVIYRITYEG